MGEEVRGGMGGECPKAPGQAQLQMLAPAGSMPDYPVSQGNLQTAFLCKISWFSVLVLSPLKPRTGYKTHLEPCSLGDSSWPVDPGWSNLNTPEKPSL